MADSSGVNTAYAAASKLFDLVVLTEDKPDAEITRNYILSTYSECLKSVLRANADFMYYAPISPGSSTKTS